MSRLNTVKNGKGSKPRISDKLKFDNNFDQINWSTKASRKYKHSANDKTKPD